MKRCNSSLYALAASLGVGVLFAVPAMAGTAYNTFTDNFNGPAKVTEDFLNGPSSDNYNYTQEAGTAWDLNTKSPGRTLSAGGYTPVGGTLLANVPLPTNMTNHAEGPTGDYAPNFVWQADTTAGDPNNQGATTATTTVGYTSLSPSTDLGYPTSYDVLPTVSMTGSVSFDIWIDSDTAAGVVAPGTALVELEVSGANTAQSASDVTALGKAGNGTTNLWMVGAAPSNGSSNGGTTTPSGLPTGGKPVATGSWQTVTFYLANDTHTAAPGASSYPTSGLGDIYGVFVTPTNVTNGQFYSVSIDNMTISAAPEPSAWLGLAAGGAMLLGLGLVSARRRRGMTAA